MFSLPSHYSVGIAVIIVSLCSFCNILYSNYGEKPPLADDTDYVVVKNYVADPYTVSTRNNLNKLKSRQLPANSSLVRPFIRTMPYYRIAPRYNLSSCQIAKSLSTLMQGVFCYLYDSDGFTANNRTIATDNWDGLFCKLKNRVTSTRERHLRAPFNTSTIFIVRNPVEKFLSGFIDKCINENNTCYNCKGDLLCAVEGFHAEARSIDTASGNVSIPTESYASLTYVGQHFAPSSWHCDLYEESDSYTFIKYGETPEDLNRTWEEMMHVFASHGVEKHKIDYILNSVKTRTKHATKSTGLRDKYLLQLKSSPSHVQLLNDIYFYDYQIFGFEPLK